MPNEPETPPALAEWRYKEKQWNDQARTWVRAVVRRYLSEDKPRTCGELLKELDTAPDMPTAWARMVRSETTKYNERYHMLRNVLEHMARAREIDIGTTINSRGRERSSTYSLPAKDRTRPAPVVQEAPAKGNGDLAQLLADQGFSSQDLAAALLKVLSGGGSTNTGDGGNAHGDTQKAAKPRGGKRKR